jgi:hypothetical protein
MTSSRPQRRTGFKMQTVWFRALTAGDVAELPARMSPKLARVEAERGILEHSKVDFPSFPYEWPPEMLHAAGVLTLELAQAALDDGMGLKDASPYNVFQGPNPVFVDVLSFERRDPRDFTWLAYGQLITDLPAFTGAE